MKKNKLITLVTLLVLLNLNPLLAQRYEAEDALLAGGAKIVSDGNASGGFYVAQEEGHLTWNIELKQEAFYNIYIHAASPNGNKTNFFSVGNSEVSFNYPREPAYTTIRAVSSLKLAEGAHTIKIIKSWGWINIDYILFEIIESSERFNINKTLVTPEPTENTAKLYQFLYDNYGKKIISGAMTLQSMDEINWLKSNTGKEPALIGLDFMHCGRGYTWYHNEEPVNDARKYYHRNGIPAFCWHWRDPLRTTEAFYTKDTNFDVSKISDENSPEYKSMVNDIDYISVLLKKLQADDVPILWRPLHEASGGWFWWGAKGPEACKKLYQLMYDRMVNHHGLKNLIWVWTSQQDDYDWYPGDSVVDIISRDIYKDGDHNSQILEFNKLNNDYGRTKMVALSECGSFPDVENLIMDEAAWSYYMPWYGDYVRNSKYNSLDLWKKMFAHDYVLTLDEMPDLKSYITPEGSWRSELYPENWNPGFMDEKGRFLHDFSYAGYLQGEKEIPYITENIVDVTQSPYNVDNSGISDVTALLQQVLDDVGQSGGGVVYLPAGIYKVNPGTSENALEIKYSNTVLRGDGTDSTFIFNDATFMRQKNIIRMAAESASWANPYGTTVKLSSDLLYPTQAIPVNSTTGFKVGDEIVLRSGETAAFIEEHKMTGHWTEWSSRVMFKRTIDSINTLRNIIYIDSPTRYFMKMRDNARLYHARPHLTECGIENLSIGNQESDKSGWEEEDYSSQVNGAYDVHASHAIRLQNVQDCWVKNVNTYKPESNTEDIHVLSNCLLLDQCRGVTVDSCFFQKPQYEGGGGNGYMFILQSNDCLIKNSRANHSRHNYDFKFPYSNGNVIHNCIGANSKYSSDFHMYLSMANLFDVTSIDGDYLESTFRPWGGNVLHGYSSTQSLFYNTKGISYHPARDYIIESRQFRYGYIIGTSGDAYRVKLDPVSGTINGYDYDTAPRDWAEGIGEGSELYPQSLYIDQLMRRNNRTGLNSYYVTIEVKDSVTGLPVPESIVRIFDTHQVTDLQGNAHFQNENSLLSISVQNDNFKGFQNRQLTIYSDTTLTFYVVSPELKVTLVIQDEKTGQLFNGTRVTLGSMVGVTNEAGEVQFNVKAGDYEYHIEKTSFFNQSGVLSLSSDSTIRFFLKRSEAYIKFRLREGTQPVNNAGVVLNNDTLFSTSLGLATFKELPVEESYDYLINKIGYTTVTGSLFLEQDSTIDFQMVLLPTSAYSSANNEPIKVWPNPTNDIIYVSFNTNPPKNTTIRVYDLDGKCLKIFDYQRDNLFIIDLGTLKAGNYILDIRNKKGYTSAIIQKN